MEGKSGFAWAVLALFAAFGLVCGTWYLARTSAPAPYRVSTVRQPAAEETSVPEGTADEENARPDSLLPGEVIDVNTADVHELQRLPGIGEKRAEDIVAWREEHGPFQAVDDLDRVSGIGPGILEGLREHVSTGNE